MDQPLFDIYYDPEILQHHGVKGMKWGQHIFGDRPSVSAAQYMGRSSSTSNMSDAELKKRVDRQQLESQFRNLAISDHSAGAKKLGKGISTAADVGSLVSSVLQGAGTYASSSRMKNAAGKGAALITAGKLIGAVSKQLGNVNSAIQNTDARNQKETRKALDLSSVSDADLKKAVTRKQLEQSYDRLNSENITTGMDIVHEIAGYKNSAMAVQESVRGVLHSGDKKKSKGKG